MPNVLKSTEVHHRDDFPLLCMMRNLINIAEIGVDKGLYSELFLSRHWLCDRYYGIDPYTPFPEMPFSREASYLAAVQRYMRYPKATLLKRDSESASQMLANLQETYSHCYPKLGFVYIDADHDYEAVRKNLEEWYPLLADNGILAGHDYADSHPGVVRAVNEFADQLGRDVYLTWSTGDAPCHSWYLYKDSSTQPFRRVEPI